MKVNVLPIVFDHFDTLRNAKSGKYSAIDFIMFYAVPLATAAAVVFLKIKFDEQFYSLSITFFGIFIALLLNVQVAVFGIFQRKWEEPEDENLAAIQAEKLEQRRMLLGELNANLSYMTLIGCVALVALLGVFVFDIPRALSAGVTTLLYVHFILTLMMAVKRAHTLFQMEYEGHA